MKIEVIPVGLSNSHIQQYLVHLISERFDADTTVGSKIPMDIFERDRLRGQYLSTKILEALIDMKSSIKDALLGVADEDLFVSSLNFVFGEANPINKVAVISITRLKQSFYGLQDSNDLLLKRAGKEAIHELGHVFGLRHCNQPKCVMLFSNKLEDTDLKGDKFCLKCRKSLDSNLGLY